MEVDAHAEDVVAEETVAWAVGIEEAILTMLQNWRMKKPSQVWSRHPLERTPQY